jgi:hypothetical protein
MQPASGVSWSLPSFHVITRTGRLLPQDVKAVQLEPSMGYLGDFSGPQFRTNDNAGPLCSSSRDGDALTLVLPCKALDEVYAGQAGKLGQLR